MQLQRAGAIKKAYAKQAEGDEPPILRGNSAALVIYRNLPDILPKDAPSGHSVQEPRVDYGDPVAMLAVKIDRAMQDQAPAGWRGDPVKESIVKNFLHPLTGGNGEATLKLFELLKSQPGYP